MRRRQIRAFTYNNDKSVDNATIAQNLINKKECFTVIPAAAISRDLINEFIRVWRNIFNNSQVSTSYDSGELFRLCKETAQDERHISISTAIRSLEKMKDELNGLPLYSALDPQIELLQSWKDERDPQRFFEMVIADEEKAKELFDKGKTVRQFIDDTLKDYKALRQFAMDNRDNFQYLADQSKVEVLSPITDDPWPMPNLRKYASAKDALARELDKQRSEARNEIKKRYTEVFEELRMIASEQQVDYCIQEESVLMQNTSSNNLYVLHNKLDASGYRAEQIKNIMDRRPTGDRDQGGDNGSGGGGTRPVRMVSLRTGSTAPLNSEEAIDAYLAKLKKQLMKELSSRQENEDIMVK